LFVVADNAAHLTQDLLAARNQVADEIREKDVLVKQANELRRTAMRTEGEKVEVNRILEESKTKILGFSCLFILQCLCRRSVGN